jgi:hypothetical protein
MFMPPAGIQLWDNEMGLIVESKTMRKLLTITLFVFYACADESELIDSCTEFNKCALKPDPGMCRAVIPKYYYDNAEKKCKEFKWGGCGGVVPFDTMEECKQCVSSPPLEQSTVMIFGHFYGECQGEQCVELFRMTNDGLSEDILDRYPSSTKKYGGDFSINRSDKLDAVKDIYAAIPDQLFNEPKNVIGCPDCSDGGGVYVEIQKDGQSRYWLIDKQRTPDYLAEFVGQVDKKISILQ